MFQHTAAQRRLHKVLDTNRGVCKVSTHSRAEAAAKWDKNTAPYILVSTHSRAEAAAVVEKPQENNEVVSTHSRAEAAAPYLKKQEKSAY